MTCLTLLAQPAASMIRQPSSVGRRIRLMIPCLILSGLCVGCVLLVNPRGEFPLNDDWSYSRTAFRFAESGKMQIDEWSAPNLVGQALYGGILVRLSGGRFQILRLSTIALYWGLACLLWILSGRFGTPNGLRWVLVLAWLLNPVGFCLSFTYMTEIPFLFFVTLASFCYSRHLQNYKGWPLFVCGACLGYAYLIRQTAFLFMPPLVFALAFTPGRTDLREKTYHCLLWACPAGVFMGGFHVWSMLRGGSTPAAQRKLELLARLTSEQLLGNTFGLVFYLSFFLLPVAAYMMPRWIRACRQAGSTAWIHGGLWGFLSGAGLVWFYAHYARVPYLPARAFHSRMPYLLNVLYDTGLGPITLDPTYYGQPPTPTYPLAWHLVTLLSTGGAVVLGMLWTLPAMKRSRRNSDRASRSFRIFATLAFMAVALFEIVFSHMQEGGLFDRHLLTAALPLSFMIILEGNRSEGTEGRINAAKRDSSPCGKALLNFGSKIRGGFLLAAILLLIVFGWFSIAGTHDYLAWNRLRWDLGTGLLASGVNPLHVSGGFEFNAWHNYDTFRARGNISKVYYWWYDRPDYVIAMEPQEAYSILRKEEYFSWLHRRFLPVYLLKKAETG